MLTPIDRKDDHGHVRLRADGALARCGGPAMCNRCQREWYEVHRYLHPTTTAQTIYSWANDWKFDEVFKVHVTSRLGPIVMTPSDVLAVVTGNQDFNFDNVGVNWCVKAVMCLELDKECI